MRDRTEKDARQSENSPRMVAAELLVALREIRSDEIERINLAPDLTIKSTSIASLSFIAWSCMLPILDCWNPCFLSWIAPCARPSLVLFRPFVVYERLAVFSVSPRLIPCNSNNIKMAVAFSENGVHFFEGAVSGF